MLKQSVKCRIFSLIVSTQKASDLLHPESLNVLKAIVFGTTVELSLYNCTSGGRKNGVAPFKNIDENWISTPICA
jgi:hypothetical protein